MKRPFIAAVLLCLVVVTPLAVLILLTQTPAWSEILPSGDDALTELCVWHAIHDVQLTGICSHNCFRNPGPMYFYLLAPLYALTGFSRASFPVSVGLINLASLIGVLAVVGRLAGRMAMLWAALVLTFYIRFLGLGSLVSSWPADVQTLAVLLALVLFAAVAAGRIGFLPAAVAVASLPLQTNVAYIPALVAAATVALLLAAVPWIRKQAGIDAEVSGRWRTIAIASTAVLAVLWALPVARELTTLPGTDMAQVVQFFAHHGGNRTWSESVCVLARQLAAFPRFCFGGPAEPTVAPDVTWGLALAGVGQLVLLAVAYGLARRMRRGFDAAVALLGLALLAVFVVSIHRIVGPIVPHMVRWMSVASVLALLALGDTLGAMFSAWMADRSASRAERASQDLPSPLGRGDGGEGGRTPLGKLPAPGTFKIASKHPIMLLLVALLVVGCIGNVQEACREPARRNAEEFEPDSGIPEFMAAALETIERNGVESCLVRIGSNDNWPMAADLVARLTKAGVRTYVDTGWLLMFGPQHAPPQTGNAILLLCGTETGSRWGQRAPWKLVAQTPGTMLYWRRSGEAAEGTYTAAELDFLATRLDGFSEVEREGGREFRWSVGLESSLGLELEPGFAYRMVIRVRPFDLAGQQQAITVLLGDRPIAEIALRPGVFEDQEFTLPAEMVERYETVTFRYRYARSPQGSGVACDDRRELAVCFAAITLRKGR